MKTILCYGDSNTWGHDPISQQRLGLDRRWPGVLRRELGEGYWVVEEGLGGRTTVWDDPLEGYRNGKECLVPCLQSHKPIDLVAIMLGTNDLKARFHVPVCDIAAGAGVLVNMVQKSDAGPDGRPPLVLLIAPPPFSPLTVLSEAFENSEAKSRTFSHHFRLVAELYSCAFLDTAGLIVSSEIDGIHLEASEHRKLGMAVASLVKGLFA